MTTINLNSIPAIKNAVNSGADVRCDNGHYRVIRDNLGQYLINFIGSDYYIGLHGLEDTIYENKLNGQNFHYSM